MYSSCSHSCSCEKETWESVLLSLTSPLSSSLSPFSSSLISDLTTCLNLSSPHCPPLFDQSCSNLPELPLHIFYPFPIAIPYYAASLLKMKIWFCHASILYLLIASQSSKIFSRVLVDFHVCLSSYLSLLIPLITLPSHESLWSVNLAVSLQHGNFCTSYFLGSYLCRSSCLHITKVGFYSPLKTKLNYHLFRQVFLSTVSFTTR